MQVAAYGALQGSLQRPRLVACRPSWKRWPS